MDYKKQISEELKRRKKKPPARAAAQHSASDGDMDEAYCPPNEAPVARRPAPVIRRKS